MANKERYPLQIPLWHIPYLEKHRIYELFRELARELIIQQPNDHLLFLKQILVNASGTRNNARIIILHSPKVNCIRIAKELSQLTKQVIINKNDLSKCLGNYNILDFSPTVIAKALYQLVRSEAAYKAGWIMVDCIQTVDEAKAIIQQGISPTHVIHLIPSFYPKLDELLYCDVAASWPEYRRRITEIRSAFHNILQEVHIQDRKPQELINECFKISKCRPGLLFIKPRVLIIGPRGSGRKTQANFLAEKADLVYILFDHLLCQAWSREDELGRKLRECKREACLHSELLVQIVNRRILEPDALNKGWVLVGYPFTDIDFRYLDSLDTPPNRVIILDCDLTVCKERISYLQTNVYTGSQTKVIEENDKPLNKILKIHPKDDNDLIDAELAFYCEHYGNIRKYCGDSAAIVNGDQSERWVFETILAIITKSAPVSPPRKGLADIDSIHPISDVSVCGCTSIPSQVQDCFITNIQ